MRKPTPLPPSLERAAREGRVGGIIIFGGSFDPVQRAHIALARAAQQAVQRQVPGREAWLLFVPAARSPFKSRGPVASDRDRVEMLNLATAGLEHAAAWTEEIDRSAAAPGEPSYTIDTVENLRSLLDAIGGPGRQVGLRLLIGSDQAAEFHRWRDAHRLAASAEPLVLLRPASDAAASRTDEAERSLESALRTSGSWSPEEVETWMRRIITAPMMAVSATQVRDELARSNPAHARLLTMLDETVLEYIQRRGLYLNPPASPSPPATP